jgi:predicted phosphodiesterase
MRGLWWGDYHTGITKVGDGRAEMLGKFGRKHNVDYVVQIGDFLSADSVNPHAKRGTRKAKEAPDISEDLETLIAEGTTFQQNLNPKSRKKARIPLFLTLGNHEEWFFRFQNDNPELGDLLTSHLLHRFSYFTDDLIPYGGFKEIDGVLFTHAPVVCGKRVEGKYAEERIAERTHKHVVFGHTHRMKMVTAEKFLSPPVHVINIGCSLLGPEEYCEHDSASNWWYGVVIAEHNEGRINKIEFVTMDEIMKGV